MKPMSFSLANRINPTARLILSGSLLAGLAILLAVVSPQFAPDYPLVERPILLLVSLLLGMGLIYLWALRGAYAPWQGKTHLLLVVVFGLAMRLPLLGSTPILEDDYHRYLWDGAVTASGENPFAYSPQEVMEGKSKNQEIPAVLTRLAIEGEQTIQAINHPTIRTIYPPVAQAAFALAYHMKPWSLFAWRLLLLGFDMLTLFLLYLLIKRLHLPMIGLLLYWWNPLLLKEIYNSAHMDILLVPFVLGAVWTALNRRWIFTSMLIALSVGLKVWPVLLLPVLFRPVLKKPKYLLSSAAVFVLLLAFMFLPIHITGLDSSSGFTVYSGTWEINDAFFMALLWLIRSVSSGDGFFATRIIVMGILSMLLFMLCQKPMRDEKELIKRALWVVAALFLLSPAQFPWYYVWVLPWLALAPRVSLLLLSLLLPLYYMRFYCKAHELTYVFDHYLVWLEYVPVWILLGIEGYKQGTGRERSRPFPTE
jgi:alpha-1,6-mannosyltransferase